MGEKEKEREREGESEIEREREKRGSMYRHSRIDRDIWRERKDINAILKSNNWSQ